MARGEAAFIKSAIKEEDFPKHTEPEIAFAGRSNVGKSSLINSLLGRKGLVKVSKTPGKTRLLNFFSTGSKTVFVDMPGYGFANVPSNIRREWGEMIEAYLKNRENLKAVLVLLDVRRKPNEDDFLLLDWLDHFEIETLLVFTKIDKTGKSRRNNEIKKFKNLLGSSLTEKNHQVYSSHTGEGKKELWARINRLIQLK